MNNLTFKDKKDFDKEMQKIKEDKNKLYGIDLNDSKKSGKLPDNFDLKKVQEISKNLQSIANKVANKYDK